MDILEAIQRIRSKRPERQRLLDYYMGKHDILERKMRDPHKPNNRVVNNYARLITDTMTGYFVGKPVVYGVPPGDDATLEVLQGIMDYNDESDQNADLSDDMSIFGVAYEVLYVDRHHATGDPVIRFAKVCPLEMEIMYSEALVPEMLGAVRYYETKDEAGDKMNLADVYSRDAIRRYKVEDDTLTLLEEWEHFFGDVPVVVYENGTRQIGDFEQIITLIDAYNLMQSDGVNDAEEFVDSYLTLTGFSGANGEDIERLKEERILLLDQGDGASWLVRNVNDVAEQNRKDRIQEDIHRFSTVPNLSDEKFGSQLSGVAISYKLWGLETAVAKKERKFKRGLQRRLELIFNVLRIRGVSYDYTQISMDFTRNIPANIPEIADMVSKLRSLVSDETLRAQLPFVDDLRREEELLAQQMGEISIGDFDEILSSGGEAVTEDVS